MFITHLEEGDELEIYKVALISHKKLYSGKKSSIYRIKIDNYIDNKTSYQYMESNDKYDFNYNSCYFYIESLKGSKVKLIVNAPKDIKLNVIKY